MNLRNIKKKITYELGAFIEDCSMVAALSSKASEDEVEKLITEAIGLHDELRDKVNKVEGSAKEYYTKLAKEAEERTDALYTRLSEAVKNATEKVADVAAKPEEKKPAAKKPAEKKAAEKPAAEKKAVAKKPAAEKKAPAKKAATKKAE